VRRTPNPQRYSACRREPEGWPLTLVVYPSESLAESLTEFNLKFQLSSRASPPRVSRAEPESEALPAFRVLSRVAACHRRAELRTAPVGMQCGATRVRANAASRAAMESAGPGSRVTSCKSASTSPRLRP
jgi:hypothetical protein